MFWANFANIHVKILRLGSWRNPQNRHDSTQQTTRFKVGWTGRHLWAPYHSLRRAFLIQLISSFYVIFSNILISSNKSMAIGLNLGFLMGCKRTCSVLERNPTLGLLAHLTSIAFAAITDYMSALVSSHLLTLDFLATDPTIVFLLNWFDQKRPELFEGQFMVSSWAFGDFGNIFFYFIDGCWSILKGPEGGLYILIFFWVEFVYAYRFDLLGRNDRLLYFFLCGIFGD